MSETHVVECEITEDMVEPAVDAVISSRGMDASLPPIRPLVIPCLVADALAGVLVLFGLREDLPWPYFLVVGLPIAVSVLLFGSYFFTNCVACPSYRRTWRKAIRQAISRSGDPRARFSFGPAR